MEPLLDHEKDDLIIVRELRAKTRRLTCAASASFAIAIAMTLVVVYLMMTPKTCVEGSLSEYRKPEMFEWRHPFCALTHENWCDVLKRRMMYGRVLEKIDTFARMNRHVGIDVREGNRCPCPKVDPRWADDRDVCWKMFDDMFPFQPQAIVNPNSSDGDAVPPNRKN